MSTHTPALERVTALSLRIDRSFGVAGRTVTGPFLVGWKSEEETGVQDGAVYLHREDRALKQVDEFYGVALRPLTAWSYEHYAVFIEGKLNREDVTHVLSCSYGHSFFLSPAEAEALTRLRDLPDTQHSATRRLYAGWKTTEARAV